jgi:hypothetical protein
MPPPTLVTLMVTSDTMIVKVKANALHVPLIEVFSDYVRD